MIDIAQLVVLLSAVAVMARYTSDGARYRVGVSATSGILMASLAAWACAIALGRAPGTVWGLGLSAIMLFLVVRCQGDMAKLLDSLKHLRQLIR